MAPMASWGTSWKARGFLSKLPQHVGNSGPQNMDKETRDRLDRCTVVPGSAEEQPRACSDLLCVVVQG